MVPGLYSSMAQEMDIARIMSNFQTVHQEVDQLAATYGWVFKAVANNPRVVNGLTADYVEKCRLFGVYVAACRDAANNIEEDTSAICALYSASDDAAHMTQIFMERIGVHAHYCKVITDMCQCHQTRLAMWHFAQRKRQRASSEETRRVRPRH